MALNIIFMGTPNFAVPILKSIKNLNHNILEVYTRPPNKKNRGQKIQNSPIHDFSNKLNLPVRCPIAFDEEEINHIKKLNPDLVIVVAYGKILPAELLNLDKVLFINVHASLLPKWRGAAPIQRAIMNLDHETGVSIMKIVTELDAGPVLLQSKIKITKEINYKELSGQMSELGAKLILDTLKLIENKKANFTEQNKAEATYAKKIEKSETKINWNDDAEKIIAKINAFCPSPGCWFEINRNRIKIIKAKKVMSTGIPGTILDDKLTIACSKNAIRILELKKEGKQKMTADEFLRGNKVKTGQNLN
jgi:methionyl-tRNA formyltransferase